MRFFLMATPFYLARCIFRRIFVRFSLGIQYVAPVHGAPRGPQRCGQRQPLQGLCPPETQEPYGRGSRSPHGRANSNSAAIDSSDKSLFRLNEPMQKHGVSKATRQKMHAGRRERGLILVHCQSVAVGICCRSKSNTLPGLCRRTHGAGPPFTGECI